MNRKLAIPTAILLIAVIVVSLFLAVNWFSSQTSPRQFYLGVEYAYGNQTSEVKALVDKVKDYTNLFVIGSVELTFNRTALYESCDYIYASGLNFIVLLTGFNMYNYSNGYNIANFMLDAQQKYGNQFLGIYKIDEPGGNQLDNGPSQIINETFSTYSQTAQNYDGNLSAMINLYHPYTPSIFTADYALNWFDYKANYTAVFAEFVGNESRQRIIALDRGAANAFHKDWGVIINWKYNQGLYLENGTELYNDLSLAYSSGAKYAFVFSYPKIGEYGTLSDEQGHFDALKRFWDTLHSNPSSFGSNKPQVAYVVPADYGFGFRYPDDHIWGLFLSDTLSTKIYDDVNNTLIPTYGAHFDILYNEPQVIDPILKDYSKVFYWNQTLP